MTRGEQAGYGALVRTVLRRLWRSPGYTLPAVGLLGLGLGVLGATWTAFHDVVLRPLPLADEDRVVVVWTDHPARGFDHYPVTPALFEEVERGRVSSLAAVGAVGSHGTSTVVVERASGPEPVAWARVLGDFFGALDVEPVLGRALRPADDVPDPVEQVAVISHGYWTRAFGASPEVLGAAIRTRSGRYTVVGVMPSDFDYPNGAEVWSPTRVAYPTWAAEPPPLELDLVGRLAGDATPATVAAQIEALTRSTAELRDVYDGTRPVVRPLRAHLLGDLTPTAWLLFCGGVLVLLVASLDLANLTLLRSVEDRRRSAIRLALGLDSSRLRAEAIVEAVGVASAGTVLGAVLAVLGLARISPLAPAGTVRPTMVIGLGGPSIGLLFAVALVTSLVAVVLPRTAPPAGAPGGAFLRGGVSSAPDRHRLREVLVAAQVALAVWVLVTGTLLVRTVAELRALDPGFEPEGLVLVALDHVDGGFLAEPGEGRVIAAAVARLESSPEVVAATPLQMAPLPGNAAWRTILFKEGQPRERALEENEYLFMEFVEPDFAEVLGVALVRGRIFDEGDGPASPGVLVVNEAAARLYWPQQEALGQRVTTGMPGADDAPFTVVGVVENTRYGDLIEIEPAVYFPVRQLGAFRPAHILVRTRGDDAPVLALAREALVAEAPSFRATSVLSVPERMATPLARPRFAAALASLLAVTSLLIAVGGVYATMAFNVKSGRRDLGVRVACGGAPREVAALVLARGLRIAVAGSVVGAAGAALTARAFTSLLYGVAPLDPVSLAIGGATATLACLLACASPALSAARTDPVLALSAD